MLIRKLNRRTVLQQIAAGSLITVAGCSENAPKSETPVSQAAQNTVGGEANADPNQPGNAPANPEPKTAKKISHRLYYVYFWKDEKDTGAVQAAVTEAEGAYGSFEPIQPDENEFAFRLPIWIPSGSLKTIRDIPIASRVEAPQPEKIPEVGTAAAAKGRLYMVLAPNSWRTTTRVEHHSTAEVARQLKAKLNNVDGVQVSAVKAKSWEEILKVGIDIGDSPGQVLIQFPGKTIPKKVLDAVRSHPQVATLRWGKPQQHYYCPPCGRG